MRVIAGSFKNRIIDVPRGRGSRPTSNKLREAVFDILGDRVLAAKILDLFAGSGAMGIEAISRGAESVVFIDNRPSCVRCIKKNVANMAIDSKSDIILGDFRKVLRQLAKDGSRFDIIYADPPYMKRDNSTLYSLYLLKFIAANDLLMENGYLLIEESKEAIGLFPVASQNLSLRKKKRFGDSLLLIYKGTAMR